MVSYGGIYRIRNKLNGDSYIGSAVNFIKRARVHKHHILKEKHDCIYLQRAVKKYGPANFVMEPLLVCRREDLIFFEQRAIDVFNPKYNIARTAGNCLGTIKSPEARAKMRAKKLGRKLTPEHKARISATLLAQKIKRKPITELHRLKLRISHLGQSPGNKDKKKQPDGSYG